MKQTDERKATEEKLFSSESSEVERQSKKRKFIQRFVSDSDTKSTNTSGDAPIAERMRRS